MMSLKTYMPRSLFGRSLMILVVPVLLIQVITAYVFFDRHWSKVSSRLAFAVAGEVAVLVQMFEGAEAAEQRGQAFGYMEEHLQLRSDYQQGAVLPAARTWSVAEVWGSVLEDTLEHEISRQISQSFVLDFDFDSKLVSVYVQFDDGVLIVTLPERRLFSSSGYVFLMWVAGASIVLLTLSIVFMRNQIRPIRKLAVAAERFGKGQDVPRFKPEGAREVRRAATEFMNMRRRIQRQISQRTDMLAGVSHDLRTPLTRLKLELEMIADQHDVGAMKQDVHEMERMIAGYLDFVRGDGEEQFAFVDIGEVLQKVVDDAQRQGVSVITEIEVGIKVRVRPLAFRRMVNNLVVNAFKYGEKVWIRSVLDDGELLIYVEDDGPGIEPHMLEEVFKPFKRVDDSRNSETGGVGLGLSIALDIAHSHGGDITLSKSQYGGVCGRIMLPV